MLQLIHKTDNLSMKSFDIVYIALGSFDDKSWYGTQRFGKALSKFHRVLFVESPVSLFEILRGFRSPKKILKPLREVDENLYVHAPLYFLPFGRRFQMLGKLNKKLSLQLIRFFMRRLRFTSPILWLDNLFESDYIGKLNESFLIYNCLHEYSLVSHRFDTTAFKAGQENGNYYAHLERGVLRNADLVFCETASRTERKREFNPNVYHIAHGVDVAEFTAVSSNPDFQSPGDITPIPRPIIGFTGTINRDKIDFDLINYVATIHTEWSLVFVGRVFEDTVIPVSVKEHENVFFLGEKDHALVPFYIRCFDVCTIPYKVTQVTSDIQTVKIFEYLAMGKPVVTTALAQLFDLKEYIKIAETKELFVEYIARSLKEDSDEQKAKREEVARRNSWEERSRSITHLIHQHFQS